MSNRIFESLLCEKIDEFRNSFVNTSKHVFYDSEKKQLIHPGEYGFYRENTLKKFLRFFVPMRLDFASGFVITNSGDISTQCDVIVYDKTVTPLIESSEKQLFFPVETVTAIGEVKSIINKSHFKVALNKLAEIKILRESIKSPSIIRREREGIFNPVDYPYDHVPSFIVCQKLDFDLTHITEEIDSFYDAHIEYRNRHNLILSIEDGILLYYDDNSKSMMFPQIGGTKLKNRYVKPTYNSYAHFKLFCSYIFLLTSSCTILYPDITDYMGSIIGGVNYNERSITSESK